MHSELRARAAFRLTGLRPAARVPLLDTRSLRPALAAHFRDLTALRYDFPVVLPANPEGDEFALTLGTIVDRLILQAAASEGDVPRMRTALLRVEHEIRVLVAQGTSGSLHHLWDLAVGRLTPRDETLTADLARARKALKADGPVLDCDAAFPGEFLLAAWNVVQRHKAERFQEEVQRLIVRLGDILVADEARSADGRTSGKLRLAFGTGQRDAFDFDVMAKLLGRKLPADSLRAAVAEGYEWLS